MFRENMHIHSKYSFDSKMELDEIAKNLIKNNISYGAITDHVELHKEDIDTVIEKLKIRNLEIDKINDTYKGKLKLLKSVEISSPHLYKKEVERLNELDLDFIMGSIHRIAAVKDPDKRRQETYIYYREILKMVEANQIDVLGHMDYINRYYDSDYSDSYQLSEIMYKMRENKIISEINTSASRRYRLNKSKGYNSVNQQTYPDIQKLKLYSNFSKNIVIGTDAHEYKDLGDRLLEGNYLAKSLNLEPVIFKKRKLIKDI